MACKNVAIVGVTWVTKFVQKRSLEQGPPLSWMSLNSPSLTYTRNRAGVWDNHAHFGHWRDPRSIVLIIDAFTHKGSVNHFGSLWPQKLHHFGNLWPQKWMRAILAIYGSRNSQIPAIYGPRNWTILVISGSRFRGQKSPKWCSFWGQKLSAYGYFWLFS